MTAAFVLRAIGSGNKHAPHGTEAGSNRDGFVTAEASLKMQDLFSDALGHHQAGRLDAAERLYRQHLAAHPGHADSLHLLGVLAHQKRRTDSAVALIGEAIAANPREALYHLSLGNAVQDQGRLDQAVACFRKALVLKPNFPAAQVNLGNALREQGYLDAAAACYGAALCLDPDLIEAHNNLGNVRREQGRFDDAVSCCRRAIVLNPDYADAHVTLGSALREQGRLEEAIACFRTALGLAPGLLQAHVNLANALREVGRLDAAAACCRTALGLAPDHAETHMALGNVLRDQGQLDDAAACYRRALALRPGDWNIHINLGNALREQGRLADAIACFTQALDWKPDCAAAHNALGSALREQGGLAEAIACFHRALGLDPNLPEAHNNLGNALKEQGHLDPAIACYRQSLALRPDYPEAHNNLAMALLARGDMPAGWAEYEWRWRAPHLRQARRVFRQPQWHGEPAAGRTLLIHAEQGFGDTLQFCRYATLAAARGLRVILEVQKPLVRLLRCVAGVDLVVGQGEALPPFDLHCPMLSMPLALRTSLETIPNAPAYLRADPGQAASWRARFAAMADQGPRVGLAWAGNPRSHSPALAAIDRRRSLAPARLAPLFAVAGLHFVSLQKDGLSAPAGAPLTDVMGEMADFADTAALIVNLDLVISVDFRRRPPGRGAGQARLVVGPLRSLLAVAHRAARQPMVPDAASVSPTAPRRLGPRPGGGGGASAWPGRIGGRRTRGTRLTFRPRAPSSLPDTAQVRMEGNHAFDTRLDAGGARRVWAGRDGLRPEHRPNPSGPTRLGKIRCYWTTADRGSPIR